MTEPDRLEHFGFRNLVHFTLEHADGIVGAANADIYITVFQLVDVRIDNEVSVDSSYAYFRHCIFERNVRDHDRCRCGDATEYICVIDLV